MQISTSIDGYTYTDAVQNNSHSYILPVVDQIVDDFFASHEGDKRLFDLGCGNGATAKHYFDRGIDVCGVDPSQDGIRQANQAYPDLKLQAGSAYDDLAAQFGQFPVVLSLEVVEHVYSPRHYGRTLFELVEPGGIAVVSTPFHGYLKNVFIAISGAFDKHVNPLWDHGHIKFWSQSTLSQLLLEVGFASVRYRHAGRIPVLAKSMIAIAHRGPDGR